MITYNILKTAERLKNLRKKAGYTQEEVADLLNVDRRTITNIELGNKGCSVDMLMRFSELYFGCGKIRAYGYRFRCR